MNIEGRVLTVAYGLGVDSTAVLVEFIRRGIRPHAILFADVGSEKQETYDYLPIIQAHLARHTFPPVQIVKYVPKRACYRTIEENCLVNETLPSLAFGRKSCSLKWKRQPQDKWMRQYPPARAAWARGERVIKVIGYDAGPKDSRRQKIVDDAEYVYWYPLQNWGWDRQRCKEEITRAGLPVPPKSACFFCPSMKPEEVEQLNADYLRRIVEMERRAKPHLINVEGLWRTTRKRDNRPGSITEYIMRHGLIERAEAREATAVAV